MKNIETILTEAGVELTDEQKKAVSDGVKENYKPVADWQKQVDKVKDLTDTLNTTQEELKKFEGVNKDELEGKIKELNETIEKNAKDYEAKLAARDFNDTVEKAINAAKGKNTKAIMALLDMEALKGSKNQKEDIDKAIKSLTEAEDSKMLFGEAEPQKMGSGDPIGTVKGQPGGQATESLLGALQDHYKN